MGPLKEWRRMDCSGVCEKTVKDRKIPPLPDCPVEGIFSLRKLW